MSSAYMIRIQQSLLHIVQNLNTSRHIYTSTRILSEMSAPSFTQQPSNAILLEMVRSIVPQLTTSQHKGSSGRIAVIGGCQEYTGAPYFAAYSALRVGADLSHVFCARDAAAVIKSYSPELIVHPTLDGEDAVKSITSDWLDRMHSVVIGPGLGRDKHLVVNAQCIIERLCEDVRKPPVVIDADGLYLLSCNTDLVKSQSQVILTPNQAEFNRLLIATGIQDTGMQTLDYTIELVRSLSMSLGGVTVICKGSSDIISNGKHVLVCSSEGSVRRCGGQGDLLSGSLATFSYWARQAVTSGNNNELVQRYGAEMCAGYAACALTRECSRRAWLQHGRAMTTTDLISNIHEAFTSLFE